MQVQKFTMKVWGEGEITNVARRGKKILHPCTLKKKASTGMIVRLIKPEGELPEHKHSREEVYFIVWGEGIISIEGYPEEIRVYKDQSVYVPANKKHYVRNLGNEPMKVLSSLAP